MTGTDGGFTWDIDDPAQKALYFWPRDWVMDWWAEPWDWDALGTKAGDKAVGVYRYRRFGELQMHRAQDGQALFGEPDPTPADRDGTAAQCLRDVLAAAGHDWLTDFAGRTWDPFHLPLFDPSDGTLSPKHPAYDDKDGWDEEIRARFHDAVAERMSATYDPRTGRPLDSPHSAENPACLRGIVLLPDMDFSVPQDQDEAADGDAASPNGWPGRPVDLSCCLVPAGITLSRANFFIEERTGNESPFHVLPALTMEDARIGGDARFAAARIGGDAWFAAARIGGDAGFAAARIGVEALFLDARIGGHAWFTTARIGGDALFQAARIGGIARFVSAVFCGTADFSLGDRPNAETSQDQSAGDGDNRSGRPGWSGALGSGEGSQALWLAPRDKEWQFDARFGEMDFSGATFLGPVTFNDRLFEKTVRFDDAFFAVAPRFHQAIFHRDTSFVKTEFFAAPGADMYHVSPRLYNHRRERLSKLEDKEDREEETAFWDKAQQDYIARLNDNALKIADTAPVFERAYQTLKIAMEENRARADEQRFFAYELQSRRKRRDFGVTILEKEVSWGYLLTSGYGRFIWIPLLWLFVLAPALMAGLYAILLGIGGGPGVAADTVQLLWFLYEPTLNPLAGIDLSRIGMSTDQGPTGWRELAVYALGGIHRLVNVILLFLTALVIRRRFQIT